MLPTQDDCEIDGGDEKRSQGAGNTERSTASRPLQWLTTQGELGSTSSASKGARIKQVVRAAPHPNRRHQGDTDETADVPASSGAVARANGNGITGAVSAAGGSVSLSGPWACEIRPARLEDIEGIASAIGEFFDDGIAPSRKDVLRLENVYVLVTDELGIESADSEGEGTGTIAGYISWECRRTTVQAEVVALAVRRKFRRLGFGSQLLTLAIQAALQAGAELVQLQVRTDNASALALYESHGFKEVAVIPQYYARRYPGILMQLVLNSEVSALVTQMAELMETSRCVEVKDRPECTAWPLRMTV